MASWLPAATSSVPGRPRTELCTDAGPQMAVTVEAIPAVSENTRERFGLRRRLRFARRSILIWQIVVVQLFKTVSLS